MKVRIFNKGGAVDSKIGKYRSRSYRKKREKAGRQTGFKDLEFNGDLRRSIQTGKRSTGAVIGFDNGRAKQIAQYQQDQTDKDIFSITDSEIKAARAAFLKTYRANISNR